MLLLYIIILAAAAVFYPMYSDNLSFILLLILLIYPVLMAILLFITAKSVKIKTVPFPHAALRGEKINIGVQIKNPMPIPVLCCVITMLYKSDGDKKYKKYSVQVPLKAHCSENVVIDIVPNHCGTLKCMIKQATVYDLMGLFRWKIKLGVSSDIPIMPREFEIFADDKNNIQTDYAGFLSQNLSCSDPPDVSGMRNYRDGDRINCIHWKLSSRSEEYIVKEFEKQSSEKVLLIPDLPICKNYNEADRVLDAYASIMRFTVSAEINCAALIVTDGEVFSRLSPNNSDELDSMILKQISDISFGKELSLTARLSENYSDFSSQTGDFSHIIIITPHEKKEILAQFEQVSGSKRISVFNVGEKGAVGEDKNSDIIVYDIFNGKNFVFPEYFVL